MPMYEYVCESCGEHFDMIRAMREREDPAECPSCGLAAKPVMSNFAVGRGGATSSAPSYAGAGGGSCGPGGG